VSVGAVGTGLDHATDTQDPSSPVLDEQQAHPATRFHRTWGYQPGQRADAA
jgi:hypothetical protein